MNIKITPPLKIYLKDSTLHNLGVFSSQKIEKGEVIDICPFISFPQSSKEKIPVFSNYAFCYPRSENWTTHALVLGYGSYYNHSETPSVDWNTNENDRTFIFFAIRDIDEGEELFINYGNGSNF
jgi:SET domain-containing protein